MAKRKTSRSPKRETHQPFLYVISKWVLGLLGAILTPILGFLVFIILLGALLSGGDYHSGNVAVIPIKGVISEDRPLGFGLQGTYATDTVEQIRKAADDDDIKAIILDVNSPGGTAVASAQISAAVKQAGKPTVAVIEEVGASGAFWIATSADTVYAHPLSTTGSIGVISSYLQFGGLLEEYNVTYQRLVAGKYKDIGSPYRALTAEEEGLLNQRLGVIHDHFIDAVAQNRGLPREQVAQAADGFVFLGEDAKKMGFVDQLGGMEDAKKALEKELNITVETKEFKASHGFFETLGGVTAQPFYALGRGFGDGLVSQNGAVLT